MNRFRDCNNDPSEDRNAVDPIDPIDMMPVIKMEYVAKLVGLQARLFYTVEADPYTDPS